MFSRCFVKLIMLILVLAPISQVNAETEKHIACEGSDEFSDNFRKKSGRFKSKLEVLGPYRLAANQNLQVCSSDLSQQILSPKRARLAQSKWVSMSVDVYRSTNMLEPLDVKIPDLIFSGGKGECVDISITNFPELRGQEAINLVLTSVTPSQSGISPVTNGQFFNGESGEPVGLLLPAVIAAREAATGGLGGNRLPPRCCPGWPACAFGIC